jgi:hypothetical protein
MQYPIEFNDYFKNRTIKRAWVGIGSEPKVCENCGGWGFMVLTYAIAGPFETPPIGYVGHFHDGKWWKSNNITAPCPVCKGVKKQAPDAVSLWRPVRQMVQSVAEDKHVRKDIE